MPAPPWAARMIPAIMGPSSRHVDMDTRVAMYMPAPKGVRAWYPCNPMTIPRAKDDTITRDRDLTPM